jgi:phosphoribosylformimino-5-aminoimidazole carboxamide ribotide isomerase
MWFEQSIEVIPAVDVLGEGAVRLERGDYDTVIERAGEPVSLAERWVAAGAQRIHLVDLDGARSGQVRPGLVRAIADLGVPVQASGGIRSLADARALLDAGADRVVVGTAAWPDPTPWFELGDALVLALDVRDGEVRTAGWTVGTGLRFEDALALAAGRRMLVTAIDRDGTLTGPDIELVRQAVDAGGRVLAAGGIRSVEDVAALSAVGAEAAIVGRALLTEPDSVSAEPDSSTTGC